LQVVREFLIPGALFVIELHLDLSLLGADYHRLLAEPPDHVEGRLGLAAQRQLLNVVGNAALDHGSQFLRDGEEPVRRAQPVQRLVRSLVVVVFHPQADPLAGLLEAIELRPHQEVLPDCFPVPLDLAQRHRMMRLALEVVDAILLELLFEPRFAPPRRVLSPVVGEHLLGQPILGHRRAVDLQHVLGRLAAKQIQPDDVARVVIDEADQVGVLAPQPEREDVGLPHLVGRRALEEPWLGRIPPGFLPAPLDELLLVQRAPHGLVAARQKQHPPQHLGNLLHTEAWVLPLQLRDPLLDGGGHLGPPAPAQVHCRL